MPASSAPPMALHAVFTARQLLAASECAVLQAPETRSTASRIPRPVYMARARPATACSASPMPPAGTSPGFSGPPMAPPAPFMDKAPRMVSVSGVHPLQVMRFMVRVQGPVSMAQALEVSAYWGTPPQEAPRTPVSGGCRNPMQMGYMARGHRQVLVSMARTAEPVTVYPGTPQVPLWPPGDSFHPPPAALPSLPRALEHPGDESGRQGYPCRAGDDRDAAGLWKVQLHWYQNCGEFEHKLRSGT